MLPNVKRLAMCKDAPLFPPAGEHSDSQQRLIVLFRVPAAVDEVFAGLSDCIEGLSGVHGHWFPEAVPLLFLDLFEPVDFHAYVYEWLVEVCEVWWRIVGARDVPFDVADHLQCFCCCFVDTVGNRGHWNSDVVSGSWSSDWVVLEANTLVCRDYGVCLKFCVLQWHRRRDQISKGCSCLSSPCHGNHGRISKQKLSSH